MIRESVCLRRQISASRFTHHSHKGFWSKVSRTASDGYPRGMAMTGSLLERIYLGSEARPSDCSRLSGQRCVASSGRHEELVMKNDSFPGFATAISMCPRICQRIGRPSRNLVRVSQTCLQPGFSRVVVTHTYNEEET